MKKLLLLLPFTLLVLVAFAGDFSDDVQFVIDGESYDISGAEAVVNGQKRKSYKKETKTTEERNNGEGRRGRRNRRRKTTTTKTETTETKDAGMVDKWDVDDLVID